MKIIDFRVRPPYGKYLETGFFADIPFREKVASGKYNMTLPASVRQNSMDLLLQEIDALNIVKSVVPARKAFGMSNDDLVQLLQEYPGRFIGFAGVDGHDGQDALQEIEKYVVQGPLKGVVVEPGFGEDPSAVDDARMMPIYELCEKKNIPVILGFGGMLHPSLEKMDPKSVDRLALQFPNLRMLLSHGGWPFVQEIVWIALMRKNVYVMPDLYMYATPFTSEYAAAVNTVIKDKIIYGSAYPIVSQKESVEQYLNCGVRGEFLENMMFRNALQFLGIDEEQLEAF